MNGLNWGMMLFIIILSYAVSIGARLMIKLTFLKYDDIETAKKISGAEAARAVLDGRGLSYVSVERIRSELSDGSTLMRVELSESTFDSDSVAAVGMAAYQAGHVMQRADGYSLNSLTGAAENVSAICSQFLVVVLFLGSLFSIEPLIRLGTVLFIVMAVFQAVMFISEADAGKRAIASLRQENILDDSELEGAQKVIRTASLVYAAALASLLASLVRMMTGANNK